MADRGDFRKLAAVIRREFMERVRTRLFVATTLLGPAFFAALAVLLGRVAFDEWSYGETSMAIGIPRWWYTAWLPVLCAAIALRAAGWARRRARAAAASQTIPMRPDREAS